MSIRVDGVEVNPSAHSLLNYLADHNNINEIIAIEGRHELTFEDNHDGTYSCGYRTFPVEHGVGLPRAGNCGNIPAEEMIERINGMFNQPQLGGRRRRSHRRRRSSRSSRCTRRQRYSRK